MASTRFPRHCIAWSPMGEESQRWCGKAREKLLPGRVADLLIGSAVHALVHSGDLLDDELEQQGVVMHGAVAGNAYAQVHPGVPSKPAAGLMVWIQPKMPLAPMLYIFTPAPPMMAPPIPEATQATTKAFLRWRVMP